MTHLVILRGNSAAGKTTLALRLQHALGRGTANVGQDHFRRIVLREHDVPNGDNVDFIAQAVRYCLGISYHVILEGILYTAHYRAMLSHLLDTHPGPSHVFYLDVPLDETLRRHESRSLADDVAAERLREWFNPSDLLGVPGEIVVDGRAGQDELLTTLLDHIGPIEPPRSVDRDAARFL